MVLLPGNFHDTGLSPLEAETFERNAGLAAPATTSTGSCRSTPTRCSGIPGRFVEAIVRAQSEGKSALDYPSRWLYGHVGGQLYLERCRRIWGISAGYPGPMAVRPAPHSRWPASATCPPGGSTSGGATPTRPILADAVVDELVRPDEGIWHFSWVRSEAEMRNKSTSSGHADDFNWGKEIDRWLGRCRHPRLTTLLTPVRRPPAVVGAPTWLRTARVPDSVAGRSRMTVPTATASVVIITYQRPDFVARCIEHLVDQTCAPLEIIVVDSSPDDRDRRLVRDRFPQSPTRRARRGWGPWPPPATSGTG